MNDIMLCLEPSSLDTFGKRMRAVRRWHGITQKALAEEIHVTQEAISTYEHDKIMPSLKTAIRIADALHTTLAFLSCITDNPNEK